ncbi:MAG: FtsX-like permease family protein [Muribaculaceae bacterium]|nr:FtsX-like permease family protein [Muribaculaceae bacterium]MDE7142863.1 FtsX-like permease family protein [Muribaculaceae bacterium]
MENQKHPRTSGIGDRVTSTISVMLVLFILGLVAAINITYSGIDRQVKEKMGFTVVLRDSVAPGAAERLRAECAGAPYISGFTYLTADQVMAEETQGEGAELVELLGVNPYAPMIDIRVTSAYAEVDSISRLAAIWEQKPEVEEVSVNKEMVGNLARNARMLNTILLIIAAALLLISFVLINNTVRLTVYSRRFLIHTMKLVGAKGSFIRRPFLKSNIIQGIVAGILACGLLALLSGWAKSLDPAMDSLLPWETLAIVFAGVLAVGIAICALAAAIATNRYLRASYDEMFD